MEYLLDWRALRPSLEDMVFWREMGRWEEEEDVETLESWGMTATDMDVVEVGGWPGDGLRSLV